MRMKQETVTVELATAPASPFLFHSLPQTEPGCTGGLFALRHSSTRQTFPILPHAFCTRAAVGRCTVAAWIPLSASSICRHTASFSCSTLSSARQQRVAHASVADRLDVVRDPHFQGLLLLAKLTTQRLLRVVRVSPPARLSDQLVHDRVMRRGVVLQNAAPLHEPGPR